MIPFVGNIQKRLIHRDTVQTTGSQGSGLEGNKELNGYGVSFRSAGNVLEPDRGGACTTS